VITLLTWPRTSTKVKCRQNDMFLKSPNLLFSCVHAVSLIVGGTSRHFKLAKSAQFGTSARSKTRDFARIEAANKESKSEEDMKREKWEFGRFLKTVMFFSKMPSPTGLIQEAIAKPLKMIGAIRDEEDMPSNMITLIGDGKEAGSRVDGVFMVTGATGGVGKRVVTLLLEQGKHVRAVVRDVAKAKEMFDPVVGKVKGSGACLQLVPADIVQEKTLLREYFVHVKNVVWCSATKIVPKEGDTADRSKYYQGIRFYDPTIEGDTPEAVEYIGMKNVLTAIQSSLPKEEGVPIFDPSSKKELIWGPLDDVVMGGVSSSTLSVTPIGGEDGGAAGFFVGNVTQANNGGFASVRSKNFSPALDLSAYTGFELRVKGDGQRYKFICRTADSFDGVGYTVSFDTKPGTWQTIKIPFDKLIPVFRAKVVKDGKAFAARHVSSLQIMLSKFEYDGKLNPSWREGPFELPIQYIKTYLTDPQRPRFVMVSSAGVTRPGRPGIDVDQEPPAVKLNDALGGLLTYKLKGEDALRESGIPYAIVRPVALTEEPAGAELEIDQGDVIKGKISRDDVAQLCIALLKQEDAAGVTFEIKSTVPFSTPFEVDPSNPPAPRDWSTLLKKSHLQTGITGKTVDGVYLGKEEVKA